jgi:hypothetical protein
MNKSLIEALKPFWKEREAYLDAFYEFEEAITKEMNEKVNGCPELEFFYVEGYAVGIGATHLKDRKKFKLIHNSELE